MCKENFQSQVLKKAARRWDVCFSLTPALSRWEREKRSQFPGKLTTAFWCAAHEVYQCRQRLFPLPLGEGHRVRESAT